MGSAAIARAAKIKTSTWLEEKLEKTLENPNKRPSQGPPELVSSFPLEGFTVIWKRHWKIQTKGRLKVRQSWSPVSRWKDSPSSEEQELQLWTSWSHCCRVQLGHPGVPHCRGPRVGRQRQ